MTILKNLVNTCKSCGITLQSTNKLLPGFLPLIKHKAYQKSEDVVFNKYISKLNPEDLSLLNYDKKLIPHHHKDAQEAKECLRCRDIKYKNKFTEETNITPEFPEIKLHKVIYVISAVEFPLNLNRHYLNSESMVVVNKMDMLVADAKKLDSITFFKSYLHKNYGVKPENVFLVSCNKMFGINRLYQHLSAQATIQDYQLVGDINSGKSSLISSLMYQQKADFRISPSKFKLSNGPGISDFPGFTRNLINFNLEKFQINDSPGFNQFSLPDFHNFKNVFKGVKMYKSGLYNHKYVGINGPHILSFAGVFYIKFPQGVFQYKNLINIQPIRVSNLDKLKQWQETYDTNNSLKHQHLIPPTTDLKKYVVPPFNGKIDLVVKNFGYLEITPTGKKSNDLIEIYLPSHLNVDIIIRKPLVKFIYKSLSGIDKYGNPLKRENLFKSTKTVTEYDGSLFHSRLIPVNGDNFQAIKEFTGKDYNHDSEVKNGNYWIG
ncbi:genetic interactor of prohibitins 3, mitochondrial [[Candida] jaroonii]|uniref:Genetic interactor of prohibitins 3, mitochondrial n=1 Tax=[Candida] jaroonii TaxID=467808 RepID=A0ACA9YG60_9ASCO|nr:genetic interactor of prohibitins 3, mitochondrial [[Candida] jaroonii]